MSRWRELVFDAVHPAALARFWAQLLDGYGVRPYDQAEVERLAGLGFTPETDPGVAVDGPGPILFFQKVSEPKKERNRVHVDVQTGRRNDEVARLLDLGAAVVRESEGRTVMRDPEGNEFCVVDGEE